MIRTSSYIWNRLTILRGAAALYVLAHHVRNAMWWAVNDVAKSEEPLLYWVNGCLGGLFRFGNLAVLAFFVVSGISIHLATLERDQAFAVLPYLKRRAQRIYPTLIISMILTALCVLWMAPGILMTADSFWSAIGTIFFQQTVLVPEFGGNTPYWSLASEGYYYLLYPVLLLFAERIGPKLFLAIITLGVFFATLCLPDLHPIIAYSPVWVLGMAIASRLRQIEPHTAYLTLLGVVMTVISMTAKVFEQRIAWPGQTSLQLLGGIGLALVILGLLQSKSNKVLPSIISQTFLKCGDISFSLYATHFPIVSLAHSMIPNEERSILVAILVSSSVVCVTLVIAVFVHHWVELPYLNRSRCERVAASN